MIEPLLAIESVYKAYGRRAVLRSAGCWARPGRITALVGLNGSGKSTLIKVAIGLRRADGGVVIYAGRRYLRPHLAALARAGLFYLPQDPLLAFTATVARHVVAMRRVFPMREAEQHLRDLGVGDCWHYRPAQLSTGERRRVEVALAIARRPRCLIADEPFLGVNPQDRERLASTFRAMARDGCALLLTGHEVESLIPLADEVVWLTAGTTHHIGNASQALAHDQFATEYLGPLTRNRLRRIIVDGATDPGMQRKLPETS